MRRSRSLTTTAAELAAGLALTACGAENTGGGDDDTAEGGGDATESPEAAGGGEGGDWGSCEMTDSVAAMPDPEGTGEDETELEIGIFSGWDESYAASYLFQNILEEQGYTVELNEYEAAPMYTGVADGDIDMTLDTWLPITHEDYLNQFGEDMTSLGCWYDNAVLTIAVNEDSPAQSLDELNEYADEYGGQLYGIEEGAGLTRVTREEAIPTYGLDDMQFSPSSTPAMLQELANKTEAGENVAVTLWRPHWAYDAFPVRDLEDPEGAMGETEFIYAFGTGDIEENYPKIAQMTRNFIFDDEQLGSLERLMFSDDEDAYAGEDHEQAVADWLEQNPDFADQLRNGELGG